MKTIVKRSPATFNNLPSILDELFNETKPQLSPKKYAPLVNVKESEEEFQIQMTIPGYNKEEISIKIENELLTISSEKTEETIDENEKFSKKEFSIEKFSRSFTLPEIVDIETIQAKYENGILVLSLPKNKVLLENKVKTISIS